MPYIGDEIHLTVDHRCNDDNCPARFKCWRYMRMDRFYWQPFFVTSPRAIEGSVRRCSAFMSFDGNAATLSQSQLEGL